MGTLAFCDGQDGTPNPCRVQAIAVGAGFVILITGVILRGPGLPTQTLVLRFNLTDEGEISFG